MNHDTSAELTSLLDRREEPEGYTLEEGVGAEGQNKDDRGSLADGDHWSVFGIGLRGFWTVGRGDLPKFDAFLRLFVSNGGSCLHVLHQLACVDTVLVTSSVAVTSSFRCDSVNRENEKVADEEHHVRQREWPLNPLLGRPHQVDLGGLRHHVDEGHAEENSC